MIMKQPFWGFISQGCFFVMPKSMIRARGEGVSFMSVTRDRLKSIETNVSRLLIYICLVGFSPSTK